MQNAFPGARFPDRSDREVEPPHKATILRNDSDSSLTSLAIYRRAVRAMLKRAELVSCEMEGMSKEMALDKFNSR